MIKNHTPYYPKWLNQLPTVPEDLAEDIHARIAVLSRDAMIASDEGQRENSIVALRNVAIQAATILETLYCTNHNGARAFVEKTAMRHSDFVTAYSFTDSWPFSKRPTSNESRGDLIRRFLREQWQRENLSASGKAPDHLRLFIQSFYKAVKEPVDVSQGKAMRGEDFMLFVYSGGLPISEERRKELLKPENRRNPKAWASSFIEYYKELSPWPYTDEQENLTWPDSEEEIRDPIHRIAYRRLMVRLKANPNDKSPWVALGAVVVERFESLFRK